MDYYKQISKRKSFHIFKNTDVLTDGEVQGLKDFIKMVKPITPEIKTEIFIVPESERASSNIFIQPLLRGDNIRR